MRPFHVKKRIVFSTLIITLLMGLILCSAIIPALASEPDFEFTNKASADAFSPTNGKVSYADGTLVYTINAPGAYLDSPVINVPTGTQYSAKLTVKNTILFRMKNDTDTETFKIYYVSDSKAEYSEDNCVTVMVKKGSGFETVYANLSACKNKSGYLRRFRIVPVDATKGSITIDAITFEREKALYGYAGQISSCLADGQKDTVTIKGTLNPGYENATVKLYELAINNWQESFNGLKPLTSVKADGLNFTITLPFRNGKITRLTTLFMATATANGREMKIADRFMVENYRDFSENPYAFTLPDLTVYVTDSKFGAKGDGFTNDNDALQAAIDYVHKQGGGKVVLPGDDSLYGRRYVATRLELKDNVELCIEEGAILWQSPREEDYNYDVMRGHDMTISGVNWTHIFLCHNYPLIHASECKNVRVTGGGTIRMNDSGSENLDGVDGISIWSGCESRIHIIPLAFTKCKGVEISDITVLRASSYLANLKGSERVYIGNLTEKEPVCASADGIGLGACKQVLVDRFTIFSNDDAITLTSSYNDPRGITWWHPTPGEDNSVRDITVKSSHIFSGHGITFITWGTDAPDLSKQEIRDIEVYDCVLRGPHSVGTWPDNPYYGKDPFDNTETDDFSPVVGVRIHDNLYLSTTSLECITATDIITDCGIVSHYDFVHGDFERRNGKKGWVAGLSNWSYTTGKDSSVKSVDVDGDHKGQIKGTGSLYQGLHLEKGTHTFYIDTELKKGEGYIFVRDALSGEYLIRLPIRSGKALENEITFAIYEDSDLELGVELTKSGNLRIDNAGVETDDIYVAPVYPDEYLEKFDYESNPAFNYESGKIIEEDGNKVLKINNPGDDSKGMCLHNNKKTFDLRFHLKITDVTSTVDGNVGILFSRTDGNNCYFMEYNTVLKYIQLRSFVKSTPTVIARVDKELEIGKWYQFGIRMDGNTASFYLDGEKLLEAEVNAELKGSRLHTNAYYTGYYLDNVTLAPAGTLDMSEIMPLMDEVKTEYLMTMNTYGGSPVIRPFVVKAGEGITLPADPTLKGYQFMGWTLDGKIIDLSTFKMPEHDVTVVASWKALPGGKIKDGCFGGIGCYWLVVICAAAMIIRKRSIKEA